ncbi:MAG: energy transducer TonB [Terracidiphilus sp.]
MAFLFAASLTLGAQSDASIKLPQDPKAILDMAAPFYNYDSATAKPFHLSYHYRLLDNQGNVSAEGKVEYWWSPSKISRISWTKGNNEHSEWHTADGRTLQLIKGDDITSMEHRLSSAVLFSLPKAQDYESGETSLKLVTINSSRAVNLCVAMVPSGAAATGLLPRANFQPDGLHGVGTAYCFDSQAPVLVSTLMNHTITNSFSHVQKFLDHDIAGHIDISYVGEKRVEADLEESTEIKTDDAAFTFPPDAKEPPVRAVTVKTVPTMTTPNDRVSAGIKPEPGALLAKVQPIYPPAASAAHISGTVVIQAIIDKYGMIENAKIISSPDESLSQAALDAVRQWHYQPYTLNGEPVPVMTTINLGFSLNH